MITCTRGALSARSIARYVIPPLLLVGIAVVCFPSTITVPGDYSTIQDAIDAASPGDIVQLGEGVGAPRVGGLAQGADHLQFARCFESGTPIAFVVGVGAVRDGVGA